MKFFREKLKSLGRQEFWKGSASNGKKSWNGKAQECFCFFASHCQHKLVMAKNLGKAGILGRFRHAFVSLASDGKKNSNGKK